MSSDLPTRRVVLPPEASTNWLFDENLLFRLVTGQVQMVMDRPDYTRYRRLAKSSDLDFLKYFLLTMLYGQGRIRFKNYRRLISQTRIDENLKSIAQSALVRRTRRFDEEIRQGHEQYLRYIGGKQRLFPMIPMPQDEKKYARECDAAQRDIRKIDRGTYSHEEKLGYLRRLSTKLMTAQLVCEKIGGTIVDSPEYAGATELLRSQRLLPATARFEHDFYVRPSSFSRILEIADDPHDSPLLWLTVVKDVSENPLRFWLPYSVLELISAGGQALVERIERDLVSKDENQIRRELNQWRNDNHGIDPFAPFKALLGVFLGLVPGAGAIKSTRKVTQTGGVMLRDYRTQITTTAQLIALATTKWYGVQFTKMRYSRGLNSDFWCRWFYRIFDIRAHQQDEAWANSQREMGAWADTTKYTPFYEISNARLERLRLV